MRETYFNIIGYISDEYDDGRAVFSGKEQVKAVTDNLKKVVSGVDYLPMVDEFVELASIALENSRKSSESKKN